MPSAGVLHPFAVLGDGAAISSRSSAARRGGAEFVIAALDRMNCLATSPLAFFGVNGDGLDEAGT